MTKRLLAIFFCWAVAIHAPAATITGGTSVNLAAPGAIGGTTPSTGAFTTLTTTGDATISGGISAGAAQIIRWASAAIMSAQSTTGITLKDASNADFGRLNFGGVTSSFPALKRSGADIEVIKADDTSTDTGIILSSPDGNRWRVTVSNAGAFVATDLDP